MRSIEQTHSYQISHTISLYTFGLKRRKEKRQDTIFVSHLFKERETAQITLLSYKDLRLCCTQIKLFNGQRVNTSQTSLNIPANKSCTIQPHQVEMFLNNTSQRYQPRSCKRYSSLLKVLNFWRSSNTAGLNLSVHGLLRKHFFA